MARNRSGTTFTKEQLQSLGCVTKEMQQSHAQICPTFPLLMSKPLELENNSARDYKIVWKEGFQTYMHECYSSSELAVRDDYSTKVASSIEKERRKNLKIKFAWSLMPQELRPTFKRKVAPTVKPIIKEKKPKVDIETKLKILEQKENEPVEEEEAEKKKTDSETEEEEKEEDDKMDTDLEDDYGNNYFDNGEGYETEDDRDDGDGPTY